MAAITVTIHNAKTNLSKLIARAEAGEEVVIMRGKIAVARLTAMRGEKRKPTFGMLKGKIPSLPDEFFFDPLPEEELRLWEGEDEDPLR
jgi:antitoxin (DNA-binding transcriptional repressor) of toxin-antitoxin stability system